MKLYFETLHMILLSSQFKLYILYSTFYSVYCVLINFSDIFHYFCEDKIKKIESLNQSIKSYQIIKLFS